MHDKRAHGIQASLDALGVRPKAAPGGRDGLSSSIEVREIGAGDSGASEPPRRLSGREVQRELHGVVRSTAAEAPAEMSAPV